MDHSAAQTIPWLNLVIGRLLDSLCQDMLARQPYTEDANKEYRIKDAMCAAAGSQLVVQWCCLRE
jgi:hypothetical protein